MIKLNVSAANITVEEKETLTEGRVGLLCQFRFTGEWTGLAKTAVFDGADSRDVILKSDTVAIPAECLAAEGYSLSVGVYGKNAAGDIVIPTVYATVGKIQRSAYPSGKETAEPTPDVVAQIQQAAANAEELARSVREDADLGKFNGSKGEKGEKGDRGDTGPAGTTGATGAQGPAGPQGEKGEKGDAGDIGPAGPKGDTGPTGPKGDAGATGAQGPQGPAGAKGADGKSAYAYAVEGGYTGTETEFAAKLASETTPLNVTIMPDENGNYSSDVSIADMITAYNAGRPVYAMAIYGDSGSLMHVTFAMEEEMSISFGGHDSNNPNLYVALDAYNNGNQDEFSFTEANMALKAEVPTDAHINSLIDAKLGVIENGSY